MISTMPSASRPRRASRTGAWLVPRSLATAVSTMRESGGYDPSRIASSSRSLTWSASTLRVRASWPVMTTSSSSLGEGRGTPAAAHDPARRSRLPARTPRHRGTSTPPLRLFDNRWERTGACRASSRSGADRLEPAHVVGERDLGGQPLHAGGAEEADHAAGPLQDVLRVVRFGDRSAVAEHDHLGLDRDGRVAHLLDQGHAV